MSADQSAAEFGMEYSGMDSVGIAFLAGYFHPMVPRRFGFLDLEYFGGYVDHRLGSRLRKPKRSPKRKQKSLFRKEQKELAVVMLMKKLFRLVVYIMCIAWLLSIVGCGKGHLLDGSGMERAEWSEFTLSRCSESFESIYSYLIKYNKASN